MKHHAKDAIIASFKELVSRKSIDRVTVKEICDHCHVNRQTFYNHFTNIMELFKHILLTELSHEIAQNRTFETWGGGFLATMAYLKQNSRMIMHIYHSTYWPEASTYLTDLSNHLLGGVVEECVVKQGLKLNENDHKFIVNFYRHVFNGLIIDWIADGMSDDPSLMLKKLQLMIDGSIPRSVEAFVNADFI